MNKKIEPKLYKNKEEAITLIPCPFCGDTYIQVDFTKGGNFVVGCNTLNCICLYTEGKHYKNKEDAIKAWNRRGGK